MKSVGLQLVCKEDESANTLTLTRYPGGVDDVKFRNTVADYGITIAGGLGPLKGKAFRVGHMGNVKASDIMATISAIEAALASQNVKFNSGAGVAAANRTLAK
jgi:aspartate aminotransferase-like enzyme